MKLKNILIIFAAMAMVSTAAMAKKAKKQEVVKRPVVSVWNFDKMVAARADIDKKGESSIYYPAYQDLLRQAERIMVKKAPSVMDKPADALVKVDNPHDFVCTSKYGHLIDGKWVYDEKLPINKDYKKYDVGPIEVMSTSTAKLGLAYFFSGDERYAKKAVEFVYTWCLDPDTYMTPHFNYGRINMETLNENVKKGDAAGIIFGYTLVNMVAGISLVQDSKAYTPDFHKGLTKWISDMYTWMDTSTLGKAERRAKNNHGCAYDESQLAYALFIGNKEAAKAIVDSFPSRRIFPQVEPDGRMPKETARTRGYSYSWYNIHHYLTMCDMAMEVNPKLYWENKDGRSISSAIKFLANYLGKTKEDWKPYQQVEDWDGTQITGAWHTYRAAGFEPQGPFMEAFERVKAKYPTRIKDDNVNYLTK